MKYFWITISTILLTSCANLPTKSNSIEGEWKLSMMPTINVKHFHPTLLLKDGRYKTSGGCHIIAGEYRIERNKIKFNPNPSQPAAITADACSSELENIASKYYGTVLGANRYTIIANKLIFKKDGKIVAIYTK